MVIPSITWVRPLPIFDTDCLLDLGEAMENAQQMRSSLQKLDKNDDGKTTIDDIQLLP